MVDAVSASVWDSTFRWYVKHADGATQAMAAMLLDIINTTDDPKIADIVNSFALNLLEGT